LFGVLRVFRQEGLQAHKYFFHRLMEGGLVGVALFDGLEQAVQVAHGSFLNFKYCNVGMWDTGKRCGAV